MEMLINWFKSLFAPKQLPPAPVVPMPTPEPKVEPAPVTPPLPTPVARVFDWFGAPQVKFLFDRLGWTEYDHNKELSQYWYLSGLPGYKSVIGRAFAWCSEIAVAAFELMGVKSTKSAAAASWSSWGIACPYWFGAVIPMRHASGGRHVTFFLFWIDEKNKLAACLGGNQSDGIRVTVYNLSGNAHGHDEVVPSPRWAKGQAPGRIVSMAEAKAALPPFQLAYSAGTT